MRLLLMGVAYWAATSLAFGAGADRLIDDRHTVEIESITVE